MRSVSLLSLSLSLSLSLGAVGVAQAQALDVTQLTTNDTDDRDARVSGSNVVWYGWDGSDNEIFLATPALIPEPTTLGLLLVTAVLGLGVWFVRRSRA
ncbi:PEP-CTERM sorting domain-containing protein [Planctomycetota bacterium]